MFQAPERESVEYGAPAGSEPFTQRAWRHTDEGNYYYRADLIWPFEAGPQRQGQLKRAALQDQVRLEVRQACDQLGYWKLESGLRSQQFRTVSGIYQKAAPAAAASLGKLRALMTVIEMRLSTLESVTESTLARARLERAMGRDLAP